MHNKDVDSLASVYMYMLAVRFGEILSKLV